jgi:NADPH2:quinone reductase
MGTSAATQLPVFQFSQPTTARVLARERTICHKAVIIAALREKVWPMWAAGKLRPFTYRRFPLREAAAAHRLMESSEHIGKILLVP